MAENEEKIKEFQNKGIEELTMEELLECRGLFGNSSNPQLEEFHKQINARILTLGAEILRKQELDEKINDISRQEFEGKSYNDLSEEEKVKVISSAKSKGIISSETTVYDAVEQVATANKSIDDNLPDIYNQAERINVETAARIVLETNLEKESIADLYTMYRALGSGKSSGIENGNTKAQEKLDSFIVSKAKDFVDEKNSVLNIETAYELQSLLSAVQESPRSRITRPSENKKNAEIIQKANQKIVEQTSGFEQEFGLDTKQPAEQVAQNLQKIEGFHNIDFFARKSHEYRVQAPTDLHDVRTIINTYKESKNFPELPTLTGALQNSELEADDRLTLQQWAIQRITQTKKLTVEEIGNFEKLLTLIPQDKYAKLITSKKEILQQAKEDHEKTLPLANDDMQSAYILLNNLEIQGEMQTFGRKKLSKEEQQDQKDLIIQRVRIETETYLANAYPKTDENGEKIELTQEAYAREFSDRLNLSIMEVVYADKISKGELSKKDIESNLSRFVQATQKYKKPIKINAMSLDGWHAAKDGKLNLALKKSEQKVSSKNIFIKIKAKAKELDKKCSQKYGAAYSITKGALKSLGWGAAFGLAGAAGPAGIAAVAGLSFANQARGMYTDFRNQRDKLATQGQKLTFGSYLKNNKLRAAGVLLSATAVITGGLSASELVQNPQILNNINFARLGSSIALGASTAVHQANQAYKNTKGTRWQRVKAAGKAFGVSAASFGVGFIAGRAGGQAFADSGHADQVLQAISEQQNTTQDNINTSVYDYHSDDRPYFAEQHQQSDVEFTPENYVETMEAQAAKYEAAIAAKTAPEVDLNNLNAEQLHDIDMLFARAPADANKILGDGEFHSSANLQKMWDNGEISQDKMIEMLNHAENTFDAKGYFVDANGNIDQAKENAAAEWQAQYDNAQNSAATEPAPEPNPEPVEPTKAENEVDSSGLQGNVELNTEQTINGSSDNSAQSSVEAPVQEANTAPEEDVAKAPVQETNTEQDVAKSEGSKADEQEAPVEQKSLEEKYKDDMKAHGIENPDIINRRSSAIVDGTGAARSSFSSFDKGDNGYISTSVNGADSLVFDAEGNGHFKTGNGDDIRPMTYDEAKEFSETINKAGHIDANESLKVVEALYKHDPESYAKDVASQAGIGGEITVYHKEDLSILVADKGVSVTTPQGISFVASVDDHGEIHASTRYVGGEIKDNVDDPKMYETLAKLAGQNKDSEIAQAFGRLESKAPQAPIENAEKTSVSTGEYQGDATLDTNRQHILALRGIKGSFNEHQDSSGPKEIISKETLRTTVTKEQVAAAHNRSSR